MHRDHLHYLNTTTTDGGRSGSPIGVTGVHQDCAIVVGWLVDLVHKLLEELLQLGEPLSGTVLQRNRQVDLLGRVLHILRNGDRVRLLLVGSAEQLPKPGKRRSVLLGRLQGE